MCLVFCMICPVLYVIKYKTVLDCAKSVCINCFTIPACPCERNCKPEISHFWGGGLGDWCIQVTGVSQGSGLILGPRAGGLISRGNRQSISLFLGTERPTEESVLETAEASEALHTPEDLEHKGSNPPCRSPSGWPAGSTCQDLLQMHLTQNLHRAWESSLQIQFSIKPNQSEAC